MTDTDRPILSIWAHYDDDLIFGNPTIDDAIVRGLPVTSVFLTRSDAGRGHDYVAGRELGLRRAYERMHGSALTWHESERALAQGAIIRTWTAREGAVTLATLGLPDGRPNGAGFPETGHQSLRRVLEAASPHIAPLDGGPPLTAESLVDAIGQIIHEHAGHRILAHAPASAGPWGREDHSDHWSTGEFVRRALGPAGLTDDAVSWRVGYPGAKLPETHSAAELARKVEIFRAYAEHDPVVAREDAEATLALRGFGQWLRRCYAIVPGELMPAAVSSSA